MGKLSFQSVLKNWYRHEADVSSARRLFHTFAAATGKARRPSVDRWSGYLKYVERRAKFTRDKTGRVRLNAPNVSVHNLSYLCHVKRR